MNGTMEYHYDDADIAVNNLKKNVEDINAYVKDIQKKFYQIYPTQWHGQQADKYEQKLKELMNGVENYAQSITVFGDKIKNKIKLVQQKENDYTNDVRHLI